MAIKARVATEYESRQKKLDKMELVSYKVKPKTIPLIKNARTPWTLYLQDLQVAMTVL